MDQHQNSGGQITAPRLRPLRIQPYRQAGYPYLLLNDPLQLVAGSLLIPRDWGVILQLLDGTLEVGQLPAALLAQSGVQANADLIAELLHALDRHCLLENSHFAEVYQEKQTAYRQAAHRPMLCAGGVYPADAGELHQLLDGWLKESACPAVKEPLVGMVCPHIDYERGYTVYADLWRAAREQVLSADLVVVFGTDHFGGLHRFSLTRQHYATPFGILPTDTALVDELVRQLGESAALGGELFHLQEHAIELPLVWLSHWVSQARPYNPPNILPILCGSLGESGALAEQADLQAIVRCVQEQARSRRVLVLASGDLSHVGPAFDGKPLHAPQKADLAALDEQVLQTVRAGQAAAFYTGIDSTDNATNICGWSPIYLAMQASQATAARQHSYLQCPADSKGTSVVSIAGLSLIGECLGI
jgi:AmmeMemoRadiSam system protein B